MLETRVPAGHRGRAARYRRWADASLKLLASDELDILRRARAGAPPGFLLGNLDAADTNVSVSHALTSIEGTSRKLLGAYDWPKCDGVHYPRSGFADERACGVWQPVGPEWIPDGRSSRLRYEPTYDQVCPRNDAEGRPLEGQPDIRRELLRILLYVAEARSALENGNAQGAFLLAMSIGVVICRVAWMLFDGSEVAAGAAARFGRPIGNASLRSSLADKFGPRDEEIARLDDLTRLRGKSERAKAIKKGWLSDGQHIVGLDQWTADYNRDRESVDQIHILSVDALSRLLPARK